MNEARKALYELAIDTWGQDLQIIVAMEECAELQKALTKYLRGHRENRAVKEEIADVLIMLEQLQLIFGTVEGIKEEKIERLYHRVKQSRGEE